jgi:uncharacterized membrane protein YfcA
VALAAIAISGGLPPATLPTGLWLLPGVLIGLVLGMRTVTVVDASLFRRVSLLVVLLAGLLAIASEAGRVLGI